MPPTISLDNIEDQDAAPEPIPTSGAVGTKPPPPSAPELEAEETVTDEPAAEAAPAAEQKKADEDLVCGMPRAQWIAKNRRATKHAEAVRLEELARRYPEVKALMDEHEKLVAELNKLRP